MTAAIQHTTPPSTPSASRTGHLYQIDVVRVLTFAAVILAHVIGGVNSPGIPEVGAITMAFHWTRNAFFFLTALVLMRGFEHRRLNVFGFWRKRITAVGVPYVIWSAIYTWYNNQQLNWSDLTNTFLRNLQNGGAVYHLYFLVVSIQFYLLFPLFLLVLRAMRNRPRTLLFGAAVLQLGLNSAVTYLPPPTSGLSAYLWANSATLVPSYIFYLTLGGVAAMHLDAFTAWIRRNTVAIVLAATVALAGEELVFFTLTAGGMPSMAAADPLRPTLLLWCTAAILCVYAIGTAWSERRTPGGRAERFFTGGTERSFGIFLGHPLLLGLVITQIFPLLPSGLPPAVVTAGTYIAVVLMATTLTEVLRRTPLSKQLVGRAPVHRVRKITAPAG